MMSGETLDAVLWFALVFFLIAGGAFFFCGAIILLEEVRAIIENKFEQLARRRNQRLKDFSHPIPPEKQTN